MQGLASDKTFHLKWNNHLQNLSQLFTTIYSSSSLADVTLSCRDGTLKAHKLVLSACSPYFEQIFKENPCQHPIVILKGIPFSEINLLVEFMYKGSVDVQELDLQSLMHTASELEIRGLAYEARDNAAQLLNVNLEYPATYPQTSTAVPQQQPFPQARTDVERLKQIHMYQQSMMRAEELRRRRRDDAPNTHTAVNNILAAAAREMEEARHAARAERAVSIQTEQDQVSQPTSSTTIDPNTKREEEERPKKRVSILSPEDERLRVKKKPMTVRFQEDVKGDERSKLTSPGRQEKDQNVQVEHLSISEKHFEKITGITTAQQCTVEVEQLLADETVDMEEGGEPARRGGGVKRNETLKAIGSGKRLNQGGPSPTNNDKGESQHSGIKVVQLAVLQKPNHDNDDSDEKKLVMDEDEETDSSGSISDSATNDPQEARPHVCEVCDLRFQRSSHLNRHRLTHTGERPFTCGGCGRSFARSDKLRVHTKICEKEDPTVDMANETSFKRENASNAEVMSGMVRTTHRESGHLVFTPSGDVMLPPRSASNPLVLNAHLEPVRSELSADSLLEPPRRGRGRPRKTPLPMTPKIKKRRGRPPKTSLDMEGCVLTAGSVLGGSPQAVSSLSPAGQQLLLKRKRGRPPKNYFMPTRPGMDMDLPIPMEYNLAELSKFYGRPNENYNASNLPFGDFSYLTDVIYNPMAFNYNVQADPDRTSEDQSHTESSHERTIDVSDSSSDEEESRVSPESVPPVGMETQVMTVGDCQIVKLPNNAPDESDKPDQSPEVNTVTSSTNSAVTITPITTVGDCTIRPVENA